MRRIITLILLLLPCIAMAHIPEFEKLGKEADRQKGVNYQSIGQFMLGMAEKFAGKDKQLTFEMLTHIDIIECKNRAYSPTLKSQAESIISRTAAVKLGSESSNDALSEVYAIKSGSTIRELIIIVSSHSGELSVIAMSGEIPENRLDEIAKLKEINK